MTASQLQAHRDLTQVAFGSLTAAGVRWARLRDDDPAEPRGDVDLLVHPADADRTSAVLAEAGYARIPTWRHGDHRFFVAYDPARDDWTKLDVVTRLAFRSGGELPVEMVDALLGRSVTDGPCVRLQPDDEFWALVLHCLLDRGSVPDRHLARLQQLAVHGEPDGPIPSTLAVGPDVLAAICTAAAKGDAAGLLSQAAAIDATLARPGRGQRLRRWSMSTLSPLLRAVRAPGITVAILGPDGAGKSTLIGSLSSRFFLPTRSYYVGLYGSPGAASEPRRSHPRRPLVGQLARAWRAYARGAMERRRGRLVVFDRYGYDALMPSQHGRTSWKRRARHVLLGRLSPRPDLVIVLDAPAAQLRGRKSEHDEASLERQRRGYLDLADRLRRRQRVEIVDADREAEAVHRHVSAVLWDTIASRRGA
jgi:thymidylate kinase